jgi:N-acetylglutamate synthase-like GNAT family acetyltransferase
MPHQVEIRRATAKDAGVIAGVLHESFIEFKALYTEGGFAATALRAEQVLQRLSEGPVWIASRAGVVVGTVAAVVRGKSVYVRGMAVLPTARGSGAGRTLMREVEGWAAQEKISHIFLSTTPFLHSAIRLYKKLGFRRTNSETHDLFGTPLFTMEKNINLTDLFAESNKPEK